VSTPLTELDPEAQGQLADAIIEVMQGLGQVAVVSVQAGPPSEFADGTVTVLVSWTAHHTGDFTDSADAFRGRS
jgi:hypothetical protein